VFQNHTKQLVKLLFWKEVKATGLSGTNNDGNFRSERNWQNCLTMHVTKQGQRNFVLFSLQRLLKLAFRYVTQLAGRPRPSYDAYTVSVGLEVPRRQHVTVPRREG
jgi:hypothetical protein